MVQVLAAGRASIGDLHEGAEQFALAAGRAASEHAPQKIKTALPSHTVLHQLSACISIR
jgi:hypothetical protein